MKQAISVIDDFLPDALAVRQFAAAHDFSKAPEFDGHSYPGFVPVNDPRALPAFSSLISEAIGARADVKIACVVAGTANFSTVQWIHADNICADYAAVLYLFDRPGFGTAFWRMKETGFENMSEYVLSRQGDDPTAVVGDMKGIFSDKGGWERTDYVDSKFNRIVIYPSDRFHSRWPEEAFGDSPENCRLTIAMFLNIS